ncbi:hypothetical protein BJ138DRAFT_1019611, partial [Hygrophoropsis aurantiaca]
FSMHNLQGIVEENAPIMWHIISAYTNTSYGGTGQVCVVRQRRPQNLGAIDSLMALTTVRSARCTLYPLCRGVYLFATKAQKSLFRVESRIGRSVAYQTVYTALATMAEARNNELHVATRPESGRHFLIVGDNIQAFAKQRDHRIGRESRMIKGFAGTAVEMEDIDPDAMNAEELVQRQHLLQRKNLTAKGILDDIDAPHLNNVAALHFLRCLINFVPALSQHQDALDEAFKGVEKNPIKSTRRTKIFPLATNSADEMTVQGMKEATDDFLNKQMNINENTLANRVIIFSGDGKTFDQLGKLKKYLIMHSGNYESLRCLIPMLELWHTKWTKLSWLFRSHWGGDFPDDPSTLCHLANEADCPPPKDLRKVDFYSGSHIVNLALDANLLNCWEYMIHP